MSIEKLHTIYEKINEHLVKNVQGFNPDTNGVSNDPAEDLLDYALNQVEKANQEMQSPDTMTAGYARLADTHRLVGNFLMFSAAVGKNYEANNTSLTEFNDPNQLDVSVEDWGNGFEKTAKPNGQYLAKAETEDEENVAWANDPSWDEREDLSPLANPAALQRKIAKQAGIQINLSEIGKETKANTTFSGTAEDLNKLRGQAGAIIQSTQGKNQVRINAG